LNTLVQLAVTCCLFVAWARRWAAKFRSWISEIRYQKSELKTPIVRGATNGVASRDAGRCRFTRVIANIINSLMPKYPGAVVEFF
jgi:hypothetical protein